MDGIAFLIPVAIIALMAFFLQMPWRLYKLSKDVLWIWPLLIVGAYFLAKGLLLILNKIEPYPNIGNYLIITLIVTWIYFFFNTRIAILIFRNKHYPLDEGIKKAMKFAPMISEISEILIIITSIGAAASVLLYIPARWGYAVGILIFFTGMAVAYDQSSNKRDYLKLKWLCKFVPEYENNLAKALSKHPVSEYFGEIDKIPREIHDEDGKLLCGKNNLILHHQIKMAKGREYIYSYAIIIVALITVFIIGDRRTSTVYISTSETAEHYHYDRNCPGLNKTKARIESISLEELDDYQYFDREFDDYYNRTPCRICSNF